MIRSKLSEKYNICINREKLRELLKIWGFSRKKQGLSRKSTRKTSLKQTIQDLGAQINMAKKVKNPQIFQLIITDFTEIWCSSLNCKIFIILYICKISRMIVGWNISVKHYPNTDTALKAVKRAVRFLKKTKAIDLEKVIIHQDQDSVFTSYKYIDYLLSQGITPSFTEYGFKDNQQMESLNCRFKTDYGSLFAFCESEKQAQQLIKRCVYDWNRERPCSAINYQTPYKYVLNHIGDIQF